MRLSRIITALTVGLAVAAVPTVAGAARPQPSPTASQPRPPYVPETAQLTVDPTSINLGATVTLRGSGLTHGERVDHVVAVSGLPAAAPARLDDASPVALTTVAHARAPQPAPTIFSVTTDGDGNYTVEYRPTRVGVHTFTATGRSSHHTHDAVLTVRRARPSHPPRPPHRDGHLLVTGASLSTAMKLGGALAGTGALLVLSLAWRRRDRFGMGSR